MRALFLALAFLLAFSRCAAAQPLALAAEDIHVIGTGSLNYSGPGAGCYRNTWARSCIEVTRNAADPPTNRFALPAFAPQQAIWVHAWENQTFGTGTTANAQGVRIYGSDGVVRFLIRGSGSANTVKISTRTAAGVYADLAICSPGFPSGTTLVQMDLYLNYAVAGRATLYANKVPICDYIGDVTTDGVTAVKQVEFAAFSGSIGNDSDWSEMAVDINDTRNYNIKTLPPVAAGNTQSWTPNTVGNINQDTINDANFISTATPTSSNAISEWTVGSIPAGAWIVAGRMIAMRVKGASGSQPFAAVDRVSGVDYISSSQNATTSFANYYDYSAISPATGARWRVGEFGTGYNVGITSKTITDTLSVSKIVTLVVVLPPPGKLIE